MLQEQRLEQLNTKGGFRGRAIVGGVMGTIQIG